MLNVNSLYILQPVSFSLIDVGKRGIEGLHPSGPFLSAKALKKR